MGFEAHSVGPVPLFVRSPTVTVDKLPVPPSVVGKRCLARSSVHVLHNNMGESSAPVVVRDLRTRAVRTRCFDQPPKVIVLVACSFIGRVVLELDGPVGT